MGVSVGRIREDSVYDWKFIGLSHNTVRGAAGICFCMWCKAHIRMSQTKFISQLGRTKPVVGIARGEIGLSLFPQQVWQIQPIIFIQQEIASAAQKADSPTNKHNCKSNTQITPTQTAHPVFPPFSSGRYRPCWMKGFMITAGRRTGAEISYRSLQTGKHTGNWDLALYNADSDCSSSFSPFFFRQIQAHPSPILLCNRLFDGSFVYAAPMSDFRL